MELPPGLFREALEKSTDAITITDAQLDAPGPQILYVNRAFETMTGYAREDVLGATPGFYRERKRSRPYLKVLRQRCVVEKRSPVRPISIAGKERLSW